MPERVTQKLMKQIALDERTGLGLDPSDRLDPVALANEHGIPVYPIDELADEICQEAAVKHFTSNRVAVFSAALVPVGRGRLILLNTGHASVRQRSSLAHEMSHHLLEHKFASVLLTDDGCARFDPAKEKQATFLSGELLIPESAAMAAAFSDLDNDAVARRFDVSTKFAQMQMKGPRTIVTRFRNKNRRGRP